MIIDQDNNHLMKPVIQLIGMNCRIFSRADYLKKKKVVSPKEEAKDDAQKNHRVKERVRAKERPVVQYHGGPLVRQCRRAVQCDGCEGAGGFTSLIGLC
jgi:hypothetical protein